MPHLTTLVFFAVATLMLTASPGPGVIYVAARTLSQGRRAGFASMFGIESGEVVWIAAAATGLAALVAASAGAAGADLRPGIPDPDPQPQSGGFCDRVPASVP